MAHITSIGASIYTDLAIQMPTTPPSFSTLTTDAAFKALFASEIQWNGTKAANTFVRIQNVREFPAFGTPANIVNVPVYGQKTSQQVQGQSDAPTMEITLNYIPEHWAKDNSSLLGAAVGDGKQYAMRLALLGSKPPGYASTAAGLGQVENSVYYFVGKIEALQFNPQLTDAATATLTISLQSDFYGAFTLAAV